MKYLTTLLIPFLFVALFAVLNYNKISEVRSYGDVEYGCVLKGAADGNWTILNNSSHQPIGCSSISQTSTYIVVALTNPITEVVTGYAVSDESLNSLGIRSGLSMGLSSFVIYLHDSSNNLVDPSTVTSGANIWLFVKGLD